MAMHTKGSFTTDLTEGRWDRAAGARVIAAWRRSGMSQSAFGRANGVNAQRLSWWRKQIEAGTKGKVSVAPLAFIPATVLGSTGARVLVRLAGGVEVEAIEAAALQPEWIAALARELAATS